MATLEIVFVGLIAFAPSDDGQAVALLTKELAGQEDHRARIVQVQGTCTGPDCRYDGPRRNEYPPVCQSNNRLCWNLAESDVTWSDPCPECPRGELPESLRDLRPFVPSVEELVPGGAQVRPSCRKDCDRCRIRARLVIPSGKLEVCHFIHFPNALFLAMYEINGRSRPVGNVVSLTVDIDEERFVMFSARSFDGSHHHARAVLEPENDKLQLFVVNEPEATGSSFDPPEKLEHFRAFYRLLHPFLNVLGRMSSQVPEVAEPYGPDSVGRCEAYLVSGIRVPGAAQPIPWESIVSKSAPHGPSECALATIP